MPLHKINPNLKYNWQFNNVTGCKYPCSVKGGQKPKPKPKPKPNPNPNPTLHWSPTDRAQLVTAVNAWIADYKTAEQTYGTINNWDTSKITDMSKLFKDKSTFGENIKVDDISNWDVSSVTDMSYMFNNAGRFNQDISNWNTGMVENMEHMFDGASYFSGNLSKTSSVRNMSYMFANTINFNGGGLDNWDVSKTTDMSYMFSNTQGKFKGDSIKNWDTSAVKNMQGMFQWARLFANKGVLQDWHWKTFGVTDMSYMFQGAGYFTGHLKSWDVSNVRDMSNMFACLPYFVDGSLISNWVVSSVTDMSYMFAWGCEPSRVTSPETCECYSDVPGEMAQCHKCGNKPSPYSPGIPCIVKADCSKNPSLCCDPVRSPPEIYIDISKWNTRNVENMQGMFYQQYNATQIVLSPSDTKPGLNVTSVTDMSYMFFNANFTDYISDWDTRNVRNMSHMFSYSTFNSDIRNWNVSNVTDMSYMFGDSTYVPPGIPVSRAECISSVSGECAPFNQDIGNWDTSNVTDMRNMFTNSAFNQDIGRWKTGLVTDMSFMFSRALNFNYDINSWDVSRVTDMSHMFEGGDVYDYPSAPLTTAVFNQPIGDWNTSSVKDMSYMFYNSKFNSDIGNWNLTSVVAMSGMFQDASEFDQDIRNWVVASSATNIKDMFASSAIPTGQYNNSIWNSWKANNNFSSSSLLGSGLIKP